MRAAATARNFIFGELLLKRSTERYVKESVGRLSIGKEEDKRKRRRRSNKRLDGLWEVVGRTTDTPGVLIPAEFQARNRLLFSAGDRKKAPPRSRSTVEKNHPVNSQTQLRKV